VTPFSTTGPDFHEDHVLDDGTKVSLRHIRPEDAAELKRGFDRLTPESRYRRFFGGVNALSESMLRYLTCVDGRDHVAIVAVAHSPSSTPSAEERGLGVGRFIRIADEPTAAEVAITVIDDAQGKGLGRLLSLTLARAARERGVERFRGEILADNTHVFQLLDELGAVVRPGGPGSVQFDVDLDPPGADAAAPSGAREGGEGGERRELIARRLLRAAASYVVGVIRRLGAPED
jgi:GNAT superfamily N-acetyltransferase